MRAFWILVVALVVFSLGDVPASANHGRLDLTFGSEFGTSGIRSGRVLTQIGDDAAATGLVILPDRKIVAAGTATFGSSRVPALVRYNSNGTRDSTFDGDGIALGGSAPNAGNVYVTDVARQPDGKLVVVGSTVVGGATAWFLERFHANGAIDTSFGTGGAVAVRVSPGTGLQQANSIAPIQSDGKLLVAGIYQGGNEGAVARFTLSGQLDGTFGSGGIRLLGPSYPQDVVRDADGRIVVGSSRGGGTLVVARLTAAGRLDTTFGGDGRADLLVASNGIAFAGAVQVRLSGRIDIGGQVQYAGLGGVDSLRFVLVRFDSDGDVSTSTIPPNGVVTTKFPGTNGAIGHDMVLNGDGRELIGGFAFDPTERFAMARYNADGTLDREFGGSGGGTLDGTGRVVSLPFTDTPSSGSILGPDQGGIQALALQADGFIIAGGRAVRSDGRFMFAVARYHGVPNAKPRVKVRVGRQSLERVVATRRLRVRLKANEPGRVRASARRGNRKIAGGRARVGERLRKRFRLKLSRSARRRLAELDSARIKVRVVFRDAGGNRVTVTKKARLR